jgi:hypothetical protein
MKPQPYSIHIYMPDGSPDGIRLVSQDNWSGTIIICPKTEFKSLKTIAECQGAGVYILADLSAELPKIYIGEGDGLIDRLESQYVAKDFWNEVFAISSTNQDLNKAHIQYLESKLIALANKAKRCDLQNGNAPKIPTLSTPQLAAVDSFLNSLLQIFPLIGLSIFQPAKAKTNETIMLSLSGKGIKATGYDGPEGFTVLKGSQAVLSTTPSLAKNIIGMREDLEKKGILIKDRSTYWFADDYRFSSPSFASDLILGHPSSGPASWKASNGKSLKEIQLELVEGEEISDDSDREPKTNEVRKRFWTELLLKAEKLTPLHARISPSQFSWVGVRFKRCYYLSYLIRKHRSLIHLWIDSGDGAENKRVFDFLMQNKNEIEATFGDKLDWIQLDRAFKLEKPYPEGGYADEKKWPSIQDRMIDGMIRLNKAVMPLIERYELERDLA